MEKKEDKKKPDYVILERDSPEHRLAEVVDVLAGKAGAGDIDAIKEFRALERERQFDNLIAGSDNDEYEFA